VRSQEELVKRLTPDLHQSDGAAGRPHHSKQERAPVTAASGAECGVKCEGGRRPRGGLPSCAARSSIPNAAHAGAGAGEGLCAALTSAREAILSLRTCSNHGASEVQSLITHHAANHARRSTNHKH
jgi:hypothetical protein